MFCPNLLSNTMILSWCWITNLDNNFVIQQAKFVFQRYDGSQIRLLTWVDRYIDTVMEFHSGWYAVRASRALWIHTLARLHDDIFVFFFTMMSSCAIDLGKLLDSLPQYEIDLNHWVKPVYTELRSFISRGCTVRFSMQISGVSVIIVLAS